MATKKVHEYEVEVQAPGVLVTTGSLLSETETSLTVSHKKPGSPKMQVSIFPLDSILYYIKEEDSITVTRVADTAEAVVFLGDTEVGEDGWVTVTDEDGSTVINPKFVANIVAEEAAAPKKVAPPKKKGAKRRAAPVEEEEEEEEEAPAPKKKGAKKKGKRRAAPAEEESEEEGWGEEEGWEEEAE